MGAGVAGYDSARDAKPGQRISNVKKAGGALSRRQALTALGIGTGALIAEQVLVSDRIPPTPTAQAGSAVPAGANAVPVNATPVPGGYAPDGQQAGAPRGAEGYGNGFAPADQAEAPQQGYWNGEQRRGNWS